MNKIRTFLHHHRLMIFLTLLLGVLFWLPRGFELNHFTTTDEVVWLWRSGNFYYALGQRDFAATFLNTSPGVTTMWVETVAMLKEFPQYRGFGQGMLDKYLLYEKLLLSYGISPHQILVTSRQIMVMMHTVLFMLAFLFARRLFPLLPTTAGFLLIAFDPGYIDLTRLSHLDGPTASFLFVSSLAMLAYVLDGHRFSNLWISAIAGGWAVLSKLSGLFVIPWVGLLVLVDDLSWRKQQLIIYTQAWKRPLGSIIKTTLLWGILFLLTIAMFFPAMWKDPVATFTKLIISRPMSIADITVDATEEDNSIDGTDIRSKTHTEEPQVFNIGFLRYAADNFWGYLRSFFRGSSPLTLFGLLGALLAYLLQWKYFKELQIRRAALWLLIFAIVYMVLLSIPNKTSPKYLIPVNPVMNLIAGLGWLALAYWLADFLRFGWKKYLPAFVMVLIVLGQCSQSLPTYPYYSTYNSPLVAHDSDAWGSGEGLDEAARYLNQKPNAENMTVLCWYGIGPFSYYFMGNMIPFHLTEEPWGERRIRQLGEIDYIVTYGNQWERDIPEGLNAYLADIEPEKRIWLNDKEYARIYDVKSFPPEKFELNK